MSDDNRYEKAAELHGRFQAGCGGVGDCHDRLWDGMALIQAAGVAADEDVENMHLIDGTIGTSGVVSRTLKTAYRVIYEIMTDLEEVSSDVRHRFEQMELPTSPDEGEGVES